MKFQVLGIETSCDDTAAAVVRGDGEIISQYVLTHHELVKKFGGVFPHEMGAAHGKAIDDVVARVLEDGNEGKCTSIDAVAVTIGPGLPPCLKVGISKAKQIASQLNVPIIPIHHLEGHLLMPRLPNSTSDFHMRRRRRRTSFHMKKKEFFGQSAKNFQPPQYPFLVLLASGGHCMLVIAHGLGHYEILGETRDDSVGEAFDKVSRLLNLDSRKNRSGDAISAGAALEFHARETDETQIAGDPNKYKFPIPQFKNHAERKFDFSFSGIKSSVLRTVRLLEQEHGTPLPIQITKDLAASFQYCAFKQLVQKTDSAMEYCQQLNERNSSQNSLQNIQQLVVSGGVAANLGLKKMLHLLCKKYDFKLFVPSPKLCTDNAVMIAWAAIERIQSSNFVNIEIDIQQNWKLNDLKT